MLKAIILRLPIPKDERFFGAPKRLGPPLRSIKPYARILVSLGLSLWLASCAAIGGGKELTTYDLNAPEHFDHLQGHSNAQILIAVPTALRSLDSEMIVVRPGGSEITYFGDAQWSDRLPRVIQEKLIQTFENSGRIRSVAKPGDGVVVDYKIVTSIRTFELTEEGGTRANIELSVKIINDHTGRVRATRQFKASVPASLASTAKGVASLNLALDQILKDILAWLLQKI